MHFAHRWQWNLFLTVYFHCSSIDCYALYRLVQQNMESTCYKPIDDTPPGSDDVIFLVRILVRKNEECNMRGRGDLYTELGEVIYIKWFWNYVFTFHRRNDSAILIKLIKENIFILCLYLTVYNHNLLFFFSSSIIFTTM